MRYMTLAAKYLILASGILASGISYKDIEDIIQTLVSIIGGAVALMGVIDAFSGYSNQSSGKQSEGIIKAIGGAGIILVGLKLVPLLFEGLG